MTVANALSLGRQAFVDNHLAAIVEEQFYPVPEPYRWHDTSGDLKQ